MAISGYGHARGLILLAEGQTVNRRTPFPALTSGFAANFESAMTLT
jgi:hypothetical protein